MMKVQRIKACGWLRIELSNKQSPNFWTFWIRASKCSAQSAHFSDNLRNLSFYSVVVYLTFMKMVVDRRKMFFWIDIKTQWYSSQKMLHKALRFVHVYAEMCNPQIYDNSVLCQINANYASVLWTFQELRPESKWYLSWFSNICHQKQLKKALKMRLSLFPVEFQKVHVKGHDSRWSGFLCLASLQ